jgi:hypothetical protein
MATPMMAHSAFKSTPESEDCELSRLQLYRVSCRLQDYESAQAR